jgi:hypothetical protein
MLGSTHGILEQVYDRFEGVFVVVRFDFEKVASWSDFNVGLQSCRECLSNRLGGFAKLIGLRINPLGREEIIDHDCSGSIRALSDVVAMWSVWFQVLMSARVVTVVYTQRS